jgi:hypothetical protein
LLDSGFSTSLVFQDKILVTGHTSAGIPSRPVPQALLLYGTPVAGAAQIAQGMPESIAKNFLAAKPRTVTHRRRHFRELANPIENAPTTTVTAPTATPATPSNSTVN